MATPSRETQIAALIEAEVERAMTPYRALGLPTDVLDELERVLRFGLRTHPDAAPHYLANRAVRAAGSQRAARYLDG